MAIRKGLFLLFAVLLVITAGLTYETVLDLGGFKSIDPHGPDNCRPVLGVVSSSDITIDPEDGVAFISGADRRPAAGGPLPGALYSYSLLNPSVIPVELTSNLKLEFDPRGLDLHRNSEGLQSLFVVNHRTDGDCIEIFDVRNGRLAHRKSITGPKLSSAQDVAAVDEQRFYVSTDDGYGSLWFWKLEKLLGLEKASILYYDGTSFQVAARNVCHANGLKLSTDGLLLYVASTLEGKIYVFSRNQEDSSLGLSGEIDLGSGGDQIELDDAGNLWVGAHPNVLSFADYSRNATELSPSQVLKVSFPEGGPPVIEEVYLSRGEYLSASSVAARWREYLLIGSVFDRRFLICEMDTEPSNKH